MTTVDPTTPKPADVPELVLGGVPVHPGDDLDGMRFLRGVATGGMAHVILVETPEGEERAVKVLKTSRIETGLPRFRREFRALRRVEHPNVIRVYGWGAIRRHPYILMEYVDGHDLHRVIRAFKDLSKEERWRRSESYLSDTCRALAYIHRKGLVHRDLKPSNIMVTGDNRCKLTDFGIVKDLDPSNDPFVSTTLVGTWAYASPEQITGQAIDHRSDIYSLGVILYAMLTGRRPFAANDMAGYLAQHRDRQPIPPRRLDPDIPEHLEDICLRMLEKAPRDRFQSASEIGLRLDQVNGIGAVDPTTTEERLWQPSLVGREVQLEELRNSVSALTRGEGGVLLLRGPEGSGRSRMIQAALDHAEVIGIPSHQSAIDVQTASYSALVQLAQDIGRELGARVPPELARAITAFARGRGRMPGDLRYQLYDGIRETLETLLQDGPRIIAIDDLHLAPLPLVSLLAYLVRTLVVRDQLPLLVLLSVRSDVDLARLDSFLDGSELGMPPTTVEVGPLSKSHVRRLVVGMLGAGARANTLADRLYSETQGNPFFVAEFLRSFIQGDLNSMPPPVEAEDDAPTEEFRQHLEIPPGVRQVVLGRLARLTPEERRVVEALAIAGVETDQDVLLDVLEVDEAEEAGVLGILDGLVRHGFLLERGSAMQVMLSFSHRKVGEILYRDIAPERRAGLHRRYGEVLEEQETGNPAIAEAIGEHYRQGGDAAAAWRFLVTGAVRLWERSLLVDAASLVERALEVEERAKEDLDEETYRQHRLDLLRVKGAVDFNTGAWKEAVQSLAELRQLANQLGHPDIAATAALDLGTTFRRMGRIPESDALVQGVLRTARARHDRVVVLDALRRLASFAWEDGDLDGCERLANQGLIGANGPALAERRAELLLALTAAQASRGHLAAATSGMRQAEEILRGLREKRSRAVVLCNLAELLIWQGELAEAVAKSREGLLLARDVLYREGEAFARRTHAMALLDVGDLAGASAELELSLAIVEGLHIVEDMPATRYLLARLALRQGDAVAAQEHVTAGLEAAALRDPEDYAPALHALQARALARVGELDAAETILKALDGVERDMPLPRRIRLELLMAIGWRALGRPQEAARRARRVSQVAVARGFRFWGLRATLLLSDLAAAEDADKVRADASTLARRLLESLPPDLAAHFRRRAGFGHLWLVRPEEPDISDDDTEGQA